MGKKSERQSRYQANMAICKDEQDKAIAQWLDSVDTTSEGYLLCNEKLDKEYNKKLNEMIFEQPPDTMLKLDIPTQNEILGVVYGRSRAIGQINFVLGLQMGIKFMRDLESDRLIEELIEKGIIF